MKNLVWEKWIIGAKYDNGQWSLLIKYLNWFYWTAWIAVVFEDNLNISHTCTV